MAKVEIPILDEDVVTADRRVMDVVTEQGRVRLADLEEQLPCSHTELRLALVCLVERGDVALFPIGDTVQVRDES